MSETKQQEKRSGLIDFVRHLHPPKVYPQTIQFRTTLGLGLIALYLSVALLVTGVLLMVYYVPDPARAYGSIQDLHAVVPFGGLVRNIHRWAGHGLVAVVGLHLLRTFLTGAYKGRRRGVWTAGVWLLFLTLALAFTGYLLPWDQLSYWAVSIGGHMADNVPVVGHSLRRALLGGEEVNPATLVRFYALHVGILPIIGAVFLVVHLFRIRRAGGLARPDEENKKDKRLSAWPHLFEREMALLGLVLTVTVLAGFLFDAPLGMEPDPIHPDDPSKAPWYFLFLQELVSYSALVGGVLLPVAALGALYAVPYIDVRPDGTGRWLSPKPSRTVFFAGAGTGIVVLLGSILWHENLTDTAGGSTWLNPAIVLGLGGLLAVIIPLYIFRKDTKQARHMALVALCGLGAAAILILTIIGWFRGPSWSLVLPWSEG